MKNDSKREEGSEGLRGQQVEAAVVKSQSGTELSEQELREVAGGPIVVSGFD
jgi:hypothetical protein